jgi:hypothetical protein
VARSSREAARGGELRQREKGFTSEDDRVDRILAGTKWEEEANSE